MSDDYSANDEYLNQLNDLKEQNNEESNENEKYPNNDILNMDYKQDYLMEFYPLNQSKSFDIDTPLIFRKKSADYRFSLYKSELLFSSTRGPPNC